MRALSILLGASAAFDYKSISVNAPRRIVTQDDIDAKFEEVDKPYALYPVDGPAEEGLCVLAEISLEAPGFSWRRDNYIVELLDDQAEPFAAVLTSAHIKYRGAYPTAEYDRTRLTDSFAHRCRPGSVTLVFVLVAHMSSPFR